MKKYLLPENGNFYKGNMHCHSTWSDGSLTPEELKKEYKAHGYSVLSITDHNGLFSHYDLDDKDFITITGYELDYDNDYGDDYCNCITTHLCAYAKDKDTVKQPGFNPDYIQPKMRWTVDEKLRSLIRPLGDKPFSTSHDPENVNSVIKMLNENGFLVTYNHPKWSVEDYSVYSKYFGLNAVEVFNTGCFLEGYDEFNGEVFDALLKNGRIYPVAADDNHGRHDMFGGFVMFAANELSYGSIIKAFENGDFYASTGPEIASLYAEDGKIRIETKAPVDGIRMTSNIRTARFAFDRKNKVTSATFDIPQKDTLKYVRFEIIDGIDRAYTRAYTPEEIL